MNAAFCAFSPFYCIFLIRAQFIQSVPRYIHR